MCIAKPKGFSLNPEELTLFLVMDVGWWWGMPVGDLAPTTFKHEHGNNNSVKKNPELSIWSMTFGPSKY